MKWLTLILSLVVLSGGAVLLARFGRTAEAVPPSGPTVPTDPGPILTPEARGETLPVEGKGDSADDPDIWIHPTDPARSLVLGTDKKGGLNVYDLAGRLMQTVSDGCQPNNVDVLYDFEIEGRKVDVAVAGCRAVAAQGIKIWRIDPVQRTLSDITDNGLISVFGGLEPYGSCVYRSPKTGKSYFFVNRKAGGSFEQWEMLATAQGTVRAEKVRAFQVGSQCEGCVCDLELGHLYVGEENVGIWKYSAEPDGGTDRTCVARVKEHGLTKDVEGLTIYYARGGKGYLIASSQGNNTFKVYRREGNNEFVATIDPKDGRIDDVSDTDGIAVTNVRLSEQYPNGLFVVQDGSARRGGQNFKFYGWEDIAGDRLLIDVDWSPRRLGR